MRAVNEIIVHHSASAWGDADVIDKWHRERGFAGIGYHFVILNGYADAASVRDGLLVERRDGMIELGRPLGQAGAHAEGHNARSIGICLIGDVSYTTAQYQALLDLVRTMRRIWPLARVLGHKEIDNRKPFCPRIDMERLREDTAP